MTAKNNKAKKPAKFEDEEAEVECECKLTVTRSPEGEFVARAQPGLRP